MTTDDGETKSGPLELSEVLYIETKDGGELEFEVVGILEDPDDGTSYAVLMHEPQDEEAESEFIVTDLEGNMVQDDALAQEILDDFLAFAEEAGDESGGDA
ncbi:MAG: hypothetical protein KGN02_04080 [bacterium]|nr:hypothetical protein [bacterium]